MEGEEEEEEAGVCAFVGEKEEATEEEEEEAENLLQTNKQNKQPLYNLSSSSPSSTKELQLENQSVVRLQGIRLHLAISNILPWQLHNTLKWKVMPQDDGPRPGGREGRAITKMRSLPPEVELWANSSESWLWPSRVDSTFVW